MDTQRMPTPEGPETPKSWEDVQRIGAETLAADEAAYDRMDRAGGLGGRSETEMLPEPGWSEPIDPQTREVLSAAQASTLVGEHEAEGLFSLGVGVRPYLDEPHWPRNGREAGAWAAGVMIALVEGQHTVYVRLKPEHVDGAVGALVDAGYAVQRYSESVGPLDFTASGWQGPSVTIAVTRTEP